MTKSFNHDIDIYNLDSPTVIVPKILEIVNAKSVIDVGCGTGTFLSVFKSNGVEEVLGIEGEWLDMRKLQIEGDEILIRNLEEPLVLEKKFDLALCLEVVEHLSESSADIIIESLTNLSDIIVFSAAIPGQGGQDHINEQLVKYWQKKFLEKDYLFFDEIRNLIWDNPKVDPWYKQNMFFVIKKGSNQFGFKENIKVNNRIHPDLLINFSYILKNFLKGRIPISIFIPMLFSKLFKRLSTKVY